MVAWDVGLNKQRGGGYETRTHKREITRKGLTYQCKDCPYMRISKAVLHGNWLIIGIMLFYETDVIFLIQ